MYNLLKPIFVFILLIICSITFSALAQAGELWRGANYGMSVSQVKNAIPQTAIVPSATHKSSKDAEKLLQLDNISIGNNTFSADFYFQNKKLSEIMLTLDDARSFDASMLIFETLTKALRDKYGNEISNIEKNGLLNEAHAVWIFKDTKITLSAIGAGVNNALLTITYQMNDNNLKLDSRNS